MSAPSSANSRLHRSLRHFLVLRRLRKIDSVVWHSLKDDVLAEIHREDEGILESAIRALEDEKSSILLSEWIQCVQDIKNLLQHNNRVQLLSFFEGDKLQHDLHIETSSKRCYHSKPSSSDITLSPRKKSKLNSSHSYHGDSSTSPVFQNLDPHTAGFYMLKTLQITDHHPSLSIDDIVVAGAEFAIICSFKFDVAWMWGCAPALQTFQKILIVHGEGPEEEEDWRQFLQQQGFESRVRFARPRTPPYGTVHSKIMVLCFPTICRVCIHTANMVQGDWDYKTQGAYMRDFPSHDRDRKDNIRSRSDSKDRFKAELIQYFEHCLTGEARMELQRALNKYDFSSAGVELVASVPGVHRGLAKESFGHARLRQLLRKERFLSRTEPSTAVCQFSSLGSLQEKWIDQEFHDTLFASIDSEESATSVTRANNQIKLVFPTVQQVFQSNEGVQAGLSLPVPSKNLHRSHITRKLCKWEGEPIGRNKAMPHIKTYLRYPNSQPSSPCWLFLGSFNLSVAAWGRMQGGNRSRPWDRLNVLSYELGVLFLPSSSCISSHDLRPTVKYILSTKQSEVSQRDTDATTMDREDPLDRFPPRRNSCDRRIVELPLPYQIPPPPYAIDDIAWTLDYYS